MPNLDIQVSADLQKLFELPLCEEIKLPKPEPLKVTLPFGGAAMQAFADISKGIPNDCSMTFSLLVQIAPFLASIQCLLNLLKLIKPLIDIINGLTSFPPSPPAKAIAEFAAAVPPVLECIPLPITIGFFIRDLLCLILKFLKCFLDQLKSIIRILTEIEGQLAAATHAGNLELITALQCAQTNAQTQADHLKQSILPIGVLLDLAGSLMKMVKVDPIQLPSFDSGADLASLNDVVRSIQGLVATIQTVVDALGGCGA